jgi:hypothetical protein
MSIETLRGAWAVPSNRVARIALLAAFRRAVRVGVALQSFVQRGDLALQAAEILGAQA